MHDKCCNGVYDCPHGHEGRKVKWSTEPVVDCLTPEAKCEFKDLQWGNWRCLCWYRNEKVVRERREK